MKISHTLTEAKEVIYDVIAAESGTVITTIQLKGEACSLPESTKLTGKAAASIGKEESLLTLTFSKEAATATESKLLYGFQAATLTGTMKVKLTGGQAGQAAGAVRTTTALCTFAEDPCLPPKTFAMNTTMEAQLEGLTEAELSLFGMFTFKCKPSTVVGESTSERAQPLRINFSPLTFEGCNSGCSVPSVVVTTLGTLRYTTLGYGNLTILLPKVEVHCPGQKCKFEKPTAVLKFEGNTPTPVVKANQVLLSLSGTVEGTCPASLFWSAKYRVVGLGAMYVTR